MSLFAFVVMGLVVGLIARFALPANHRMGLFSTCLLGILGAVVGGGFLAALFDGRGFELRPVDMTLGFLGSTLLLVLVGTTNSRRAHG